LYAFGHLSGDEMADKTYDALCEDASAAAETRLLEHFKQHGGEVWSIGTGCQSCRQKLEDVDSLKVQPNVSRVVRASLL
jgi:hypothetical protein